MFGTQRTVKERIAAPVLTFLGLLGVGGTAYLGANAGAANAAPSASSLELKDASATDALRTYVGKQMLDFVSTNQGQDDGNVSPAFVAEVKRDLKGLTTSADASRVWVLNVGEYVRINWSPVDGVQMVSRDEAERIEEVNGAKYGAVIAIQNGSPEVGITVRMGNGTTSVTGRIDSKTFALNGVEPVAKATTKSNYCLPVVPCTFDR